MWPINRQPYIQSSSGVKAITRLTRKHENHLLQLNVNWTRSPRRGGGGSWWGAVCCLGFSSTLCGISVKSLLQSTGWCYLYGHWWPAGSTVTGSAWQDRGAISTNATLQLQSVCEEWGEAVITLVHHFLLVVAAFKPHLQSEQHCWFVDKLLCGKVCTYRTNRGDLPSTETNTGPKLNISCRKMIVCAANPSWNWSQWLDYCYSPWCCKQFSFYSRMLLCSMWKQKLKSEGGLGGFFDVEGRQIFSLTFQSQRQP